MQRRTMIRVLGGAAVVAAGGIGGFLATRRPDRALAPWHAPATGETDPRRRALSYAILAPNPHNRQPWLVRLDGDDALTVYCELDRRLPDTDPFDRQIVIGLGCFLELFRIAAARDGYRAEIDPFPEGEPAPRLDTRAVARVRLHRDSGLAADPLFDNVLDRRSTRKPFDAGRPVAPSVLAALVEAGADRARVRTVDGSSDVEALRDLTWRAHEVEMRTPRTLMESVRLMRIGKAEIEASPDGIALGGPFLESLHVAGMLDREQLADPSSSASAQGMDMYRAMLDSAMAYVTVTTSGNMRADQLAAGAAYLRIDLAAAGEGVAIHPLSQALQEYPEMAALRSESDDSLGVRAPHRLQMLARLGYGPSIDPSPRWPAETRLITG